MVRRLAIILASIGLALAVSTSGAPTARADVVPLGEWSFAVSRPSYAKNDIRTSFTAQVDTLHHSRTVAWSLRLSPGLRAIATGDMTCDTDVAGLKGYHDHHVVSTGYLLHSSAPKHKFNKLYILQGKCTFPVKVGSRTGRATLEYGFKYNIFSLIATQTSIRSQADLVATAKKKAYKTKIKYKWKKRS